ncbi:MAG: hypothetical protein NC397_08930 [Clostridium sp.]|nr:hypothetical protein [Clostridium sp.]
MADGSIRIAIKIDGKEAEFDLKDLVKNIEKVSGKIKETGKNAKIGIDVNQAEKNIAKLEKDIDKYQAKLDALNTKKQELNSSGKNVQLTKIYNDAYARLGSYEERYKKAIERIEKLKFKGTNRRSSSWDDAQYDKEQATKKIEAYSKTLEELEQYGQKFELSKEFKKTQSDIQAVKEKITQAKQEQEKLAKSINDAANPAEQVERKFHSIRDALAAAGREAKEMQIKPVGDYAVEGFNKVLNFFDNMKEKAASAGQSIKSSITNGFNYLRNGGLAQTLQNGANKITSFRDQINNAIGKAGEKFGELPLKARNAGIKAVAFIRNGFRNLKDTQLINTESMKTGLQSVAQKIKSGIVGGLKTAGNWAKRLGKSFSNVAKTISSKIGSGLKSAVSRMKNIGKSADSMRKKFMKIGLSLVGMRSVMAGFKQLVSSALNNNEKLQKQLTAVKGVMGEALAPAINVLVDGLSKIVSFADKIYQTFTGTSLVAKYNAKQAQKVADSTKDSADSAKEYKKQMAGFDVANAFSDDSSKDKSDTDSDSEASLFEATNLSAWMDKIIHQLKSGDWNGVGETIAGGINSALDKINWSGIQNKVNTFCTNIGASVNGFVNALDWDKVGNSIGNGLNTITMGLNSFVDSVKWESLGAGISTGLNGIVNKIDAEALGKTLSAKLKVLTNSLYGFFNGDGKNEGFDFSALGKKIGDTFNSWINNIDWGKAASNISNAFKGLGDTISGAMDSINWNNGDDSITAKIQDFFSNIDWAGMLKSACTALGKALGGLGSTVVQLLKDAWNDWKATYIDPAIDEAGGNVIEGVFNGIVNWLKNVGTWIKENIFDPFIEGFKSTFDIHSPSKDPTILEIGKNIIEGVFNGVVDWIKDIGTWLEENVFDKITDAWDGMKELTISIGGKISESFNKVKDKWDSFKDKTATLIGNAKEKSKDVFKNLKGKFDNIKNTTKTLTGNAKEKSKNVFSNLKKKFDKIKNVTKTLTGQAKENAKAKFSSMKSKFDSIKDKTTTMTAEFKDKITTAFKNVLQKAVDMINKVITALNKIPGINISKIPDVKLAKGGIVNNPGRGVQATIGEAGAEAVLPLENNTGWMDIMADKLAQRLVGNGQPIVVYSVIDGKIIGKAVAKYNSQQNFIKNGGTV